MLKTRVKGSGRLIIGDKVFNFENKVNSNYLSAPMTMIDIEKLGRNIRYEGTTDFDINLLNLAPVQEFSLTENVITEQDILFTSLANIPITDFTIIQSSMYKTTIRATGTIERSGIVKSAGFNILKTQESSSTQELIMNQPYRIVEIPISTQLGELPSDLFLYHPINKALYAFGYGDSVHKLSYDVETGEMGEQFINLNQPFNTNGYCDTIIPDGRYVAVGDDGYGLYFFDFITETSSKITLTSGVPRFGNDQYHDYVAWDENINALRCIKREYSSNTRIEGYTVELNGTVTKYTGWWSFDGVSYIKDNIIEVPQGFRRNNAESSFTYIATYPTFKRLRNQHRLFDENGIATVVSFNTFINPSSMILEFFRKPDYHKTLFEVNEVSVSSGQSFTVEYTFESIDER